MSETQFSWSQFPQYTEEQLKRASKSFKSSVNWAKYKEWVEAGKPFKEHNELLSIDQADQKLENSSYNRPVDKENKEMDLALTKVSGRPTESLGKEAMTFLPLTELKPPLVTRVNIVVKLLNPIQFLTLLNYTKKMIQDLERDNIFNTVIGLNI
uniref:Uncharacterized protein n=1 Tax=Rhizophagus irregularis (strain DAOM 181602 / DAOM 197198 / MUCL 43194) TaxID=747089 RepID=U9SKN4_RHIID